MPKTTGQTLSGWQELTSSLSANSADVPHLEGHRAQLADLLKQAQDLTTQQAALTASKQEVTKKLQGVMDDGKKVAAFLRAGVRQRYGKRAEKLIEFGLRPFRGLRRKETDPSTPARPASLIPPIPSHSEGTSRHSKTSSHRIPRTSSHPKGRKNAASSASRGAKGSPRAAPPPSRLSNGSSRPIPCGE